MIKLSKKQIESLREKVNAFDEMPIHKCVVLTRVRALRLYPVEVDGVWKQILRPESDDNLSNREKNGQYPFYTGVVYAVGADANPAIKRGDIVRFSPLSGELFDVPPSSDDMLNCQDVEVKIISGNIFKYEGEDIES